MTKNRTWRSTYTPGTWVVLSGPKALVAAEPTTPDVAKRLSSIWADVVAAEDIGALVGRLMRWGMDVVPDLIVVVEGDDLQCVVRGAVRVHDADTQALVATGQNQTAWRSVPLGTQHIKIDFPGGKAEVADWRLPLAVGVVSASSIEIDARDGARVDVGDGLVFGTSAAAAVLLNDLLAPVEVPPVAAPVVVETPPVEVVAEPVEAQPVVEAVAAPAEVEVPAEAEPEPAADGWQDLPEQPEAPAVVPAEVSQPEAVAEEVAEVAAAGSPTGATALIFSDGQSFGLSDPILVGRAPQVYPEEEAELVRVASPNHDISRTHIRIELFDGAVWVTDRESTNGTIVNNPGEESVTATPGEPVHVWVGGLIDIGDGVIIRVQ